MTYSPQRITAPDGTPLVVITEADYLSLLDAADIAAANKALAESDFVIPGEVMDAMLDGKSPIAAWREYRGLTQEALAAAATMLQPALARIEASKGQPRRSTIEKLATALGVEPWALNPAE